jgi:hypothetical protein
LRIAAVISGTIVIGLVAYVWIWDTYTPRPEGYDVSADSREINVAFCGGTADTIDALTSREDARTVIVGARLRRHRDQFEHGTVLRVTFPLTTPLAGRTVRDPGGNAVTQGSQFLCPG